MDATASPGIAPVTSHPAIPRRPPGRQSTPTPSIPRRPAPKPADSGSDGSVSGGSTPSHSFEARAVSEMPEPEPTDGADVQHLGTSVPMPIPAVPRRPYSPSVNLRPPQDEYESEQQIAEIEMDVSRTVAETQTRFRTPDDSPSGYEGMEHVYSVLSRNDNQDANDSFTDAELSGLGEKAATYQARNQPTIPQRPSLASSHSSESEHSNPAILSPVPHIPERPRTRNPPATLPVTDRPSTQDATPEIPRRPASAAKNSQPENVKSPAGAIVPPRPASRPVHSHADLHVHISPDAVAADSTNDGNLGLLHNVATFKSLDSDPVNDPEDETTTFDIAAKRAQEELENPEEYAERQSSSLLKRADVKAGIIEPLGTPSEPSAKNSPARMAQGHELECSEDIDEDLDSILDNYLEEHDGLTEADGSDDNMSSSRIAPTEPVAEPSPAESANEHESSVSVGDPQAESEAIEDPETAKSESAQSSAAIEPQTDSSTTLAADGPQTESTVTLAADEPQTESTTTLTAVEPQESTTNLTSGEPHADEPQTETESVSVAAPPLEPEQPKTVESKSEDTEKTDGQKPDEAATVGVTPGIETAMPEIPRRPARPQIPRRPAKPLSSGAADGGLPTLATPASGSAGDASTVAPPVVTKPKPPPPARPNKLTGIRAAFAKDLESRFGKGGPPMPFMKRPAPPIPSQAAEPEPEPASPVKSVSVAAPVKETKLDDVRKGRARGPKGRKLPAPVILPGGWEFSPVITIWEVESAKPEAVEAEAVKPEAVEPEVVIPDVSKQVTREVASSEPELGGLNTEPAVASTEMVSPAESVATPALDQQADVSQQIDPPAESETQHAAIVEPAEMSGDTDADALQVGVQDSRDAEPVADNVGETPPPEPEVGDNGAEDLQARGLVTKGPTIEEPLASATEDTEVIGQDLELTSEVS